MRAPPAASVVPAALSKEWLLGNGLGDFAGGTVSGAHVRPFHAYLVLADPPAGRVPLLLRLDARVTDGSLTYELIGADDGEPRGLPPAEIVSFEHRPWPTWRYRAAGVIVEKRLLLLSDRHALIAEYRVIEGQNARVTVAPSFEAPGEGATAPSLQSIPGRIRVAIAPGRSVTVWHNGAFMPSRGADRVPYVPGFIEAALAPGEPLQLLVSTDELLLRGLAEVDRLGTPPPRTLAGCVTAIERWERARTESVDRAVLVAASFTAAEAHAARPTGESGATPIQAFRSDDPWLFRLARGVELGFTSRDHGESIVRSVPLGRRSGEAALRCVRGLVGLRSFERAREILLGYGQLIREGLVPSGFDDTDKPVYEAAEPSLWFVIATELFARRSGELEFVRHALAPSVEQVIDRYRDGTRLGIGVAEDGLLTVGEGSERWKRADLNALWYYAQVAAAQLAKALGRKQNSAFYVAWARELQARYNEVLWDDDAGRLHVALAGDEPIPGVEPSQALAASLLPALLPPERASRLVETLERELRTPAGMRESPGSERLLTEWLEPFFTAWIRGNGRTPEAEDRVRAWMDDLARATDERATGFVPERFESATATVNASDLSDLRYAGDPISVLASTELLRMWVEEIDRGES